MEIQEFIEKLADAIEAEKSKIEATTIFRELDEWNSLAGLSVISMFDEEFSKELPISAFKKAITVEDLFKLAQ